MPALTRWFINAAMLYLAAALLLALALAAVVFFVAHSWRRVVSREGR